VVATDLLGHHQLLKRVGFGDLPDLKGDLQQTSYSLVCYGNGHPYLQTVLYCDMSAAEEPLLKRDRQVGRKSEAQRIEILVLFFKGL
jgi:hypothetical protein